MSAELFDDNRSCINNCLGANPDNVFCLEPITEYGYCCDSRDVAECSGDHLCTYQAPVDSVGLHLWPCVHEP